MPTGFFDLPREVRDVIYEYSVINMRNHTHREDAKGHFSGDTCLCDNLLLHVVRAQPPYFASSNSVFSCFVADRWIYKMTLVSKQFGAEARPRFWQRTPIEFGTCYYERPAAGTPRSWSPWLECYREFFKSLGPEAKHLRFLATERLTGPMNEDGFLKRERQNVPTEDEAEQELEFLRDLVHPRINIYIELESSTRNKIFHCKVSHGGDKAFVAQRFHTSGKMGSWSDMREWWAYIEQAVREAGIYELNNRCKM